jgi:hypothetical protein
LTAGSGNGMTIQPQKGNETNLAQGKIMSAFAVYVFINYTLHFLHLFSVIHFFPDPSSA